MLVPWRVSKASEERLTIFVVELVGSSSNDVGTTYRLCSPQINAHLHARGILMDCFLVDVTMRNIRAPGNTQGLTLTPTPKSPIPSRDVLRVPNFETSAI